MDATQEALRRAAGNRDELKTILDPLAREAARGSRTALETVVWAVDELALARPAIERLVIGEADVDDVAQDVLIAVAENIASYRGDAPFTAWLTQVAKFKAIDHLRRRRDESAEVPELTDAVRISSMLANRAVLDDVLTALPERYRQAVVLRDVEHLAYDEIAHRLGVNLNTVKTRIRRGRALAGARLAGG
jgi:RNA polymerase sigma factor (sigma-70 family)